MLELFYIALLIILLGIFFFIVIPACIRSFYPTKAPFIPTRRGAMSHISKAIALKPNSVLYDLGCGDCRILLEAIRSFPPASNVRGVGIEKDWLPWLIARWKTRKSSIDIRLEDLFSANFSEASHIYCFLLPRVLAMLEPEIIKQCKPGTRIVTCDFSFPNLKPQEIIHIPNQYFFQLSRQLFVYIV